MLHSRFDWCGRRDLNSYAFWALEPKSSASAIPPRPQQIRPMKETQLCEANAETKDASIARTADATAIATVDIIQ
jgi:hypothetical protein